MSKAVEQAAPRPVEAVRISPALRRIVLGLAAEDRITAQQGLDAIIDQVPEYRDAERSYGGESVQEMYGHCLLTTQVWYRSLLRFGEPTAADLEKMKAIGGHKGRLSIPVGALLQALRVVSILYWDQLIAAAENDAAISNELLTKVSRFLLHHFDVVAQAFSRGYYDEQQRLILWRDRLRSDLCGVIFGNPDDRAAFDEYTLALGIEAGLPHSAIALRAKLDHSDPTEAADALHEIVAAVADLVQRPEDRLLYAVRYGHVLLWLPMRGGDAVCGERQLSEQCERLAGGKGKIASIGVGLPDVGPHGFRRSADQAVRALETGGRARSMIRVHRYVQYAVEDMAAQAPSFARYCEYLLERLAGDETDLAETLQVYFDNEQQRKPAAHALNIHPNTLTYRLSRIEALLGARLGDTGWIATLHAALGMRRQTPARRPVR